MPELATDRGRFERDRGVDAEMKDGEKETPVGAGKGRERIGKPRVSKLSCAYYAAGRFKPSSPSPPAFAAKHDFIEGGDRHVA
jgi:hypothetical protein